VHGHVQLAVLELGHLHERPHAPVHSAEHVAQVVAGAHVLVRQLHHQRTKTMNTKAITITAAATMVIRYDDAVARLRDLEADLLALLALLVLLDLLRVDRGEAIVLACEKNFICETADLISVGK
jgi:hypothetical protein